MDNSVHKLRMANDLMNLQEPISINHWIWSCLFEMIVQIGSGWYYYQSNPHCNWRIVESPSRIVAQTQSGVLEREYKEEDGIVVWILLNS